MQPRFGISVDAIHPHVKEPIELYHDQRKLAMRGLSLVFSNAMMRYSMIGIGLAFAVGIIAARILPSATPTAAGYLSALGIALIAIILSRWRRGFLVLLLISISLLGILRTHTGQLPFARLYQRASNLREVTGTVVSYPQLGEKYVAFTLAPDHIPGRIRVTWFCGKGAHTPILYGDRLRLVGTGRVPPRFPDFDYRAYLARQGIFATFAVDAHEHVEHLGTQGNSLIRYGDHLRQQLIAKLDRLLPPEEAGLAHGLLFGDRTAIPGELSSAFRHTGLMHLLAVSGLHLGIFLAGLWFLLRFIGLRPAVTYPIVGLAVGFALWVIGPRVSLIRAALLFAFLGLGSVLADLGVILRRWVNPLQSLAAAGVVILALRPTALYDVGFQLSFGATAAILVMFDPGFRVTEWVDHVAARAPSIALPVRYVLLLLITSTAAQAGTAPFLAYQFKMIYPLSLFGNLVAIPLATVALWSGLTALLFSATPLIVPLGWVFYFTLHALAWLVTWLSHLPLAALMVPGWTGVWIGGMVAYILLMAIYFRDCSSCTSYSTSITFSSAEAPCRRRDGTR